MGDDGGADLRGVDGVRRLAELAALELGDGEAERLAGELGEILEHFRVIQEGTEGHGAMEGGAATEGRTGTGAPLREDRVGADPMARPPSEDAPDFRRGFFTVPRLGSHADPEDGEGGS